MDGGRVERDAGPVTPELRSVAARQQGVVLTRQARALGVSETQLARLRADRALVPVRRGALADATVWEGLGARERHRALVVATVLLGEDDTAVLSHWAAAALHGLPLLGAWPAKVHVTTPQGGSTRASGLVVRHPAPLPETDVAVVDGYRVTTVARTVVDLTRRLDFAGGVVVADAALQRRLSTPGKLDATLAAQALWPGIRQARRTIAFADGSSESPGESWSRVVVNGLGLPAPALQVVLQDRTGPIGRVDFLWRDQRTVGEFDGKVKYGGLDAARDPREVLWAEKKREDRLRGLGLEVARWWWSHLERPEELDGVLRAAFARGARP